MTEQTLFEKVQTTLRNGKTFGLRQCSICDVELYYYADIHGDLHYNSSCDCSSLNWPTERDWDQLKLLVDDNPKMFEYWLKP